MKKCLKVIAIFKKFSKQEQADFELFLSSPYFKIPENIQLLYQYIKTETQQFNPFIDCVNKSAKEILQNLSTNTTIHVYENEAECDIFLSNLLYRLMQKIKLFFATEAIANPNNEALADMGIIFYFEDKSKYDFLAEEHLKRALEKASNPIINDYTSFIYNFIFAFYYLKNVKQENFKLNSNKNKKQTSEISEIKKRKRLQYEQAKESMLENLYQKIGKIFHELELATKCHLPVGTHNKIITEKPYFFIADHVIEHLIQSNFFDNPYLELQYYLLKFSQTPSEELKSKILFTIEQHKKRLHPMDLRLSYRKLIDYVNSQITPKTLPPQVILLNKELFQLSEKRLKLEDKINAINIKNFVTLGIRAEEFEKTERILGDLIAKIDIKTNTEMVESYNLAQIKFAQKKYNETLQDIQTAIKNEKADIYYVIGTKILEIKCLYEIVLKTPTDEYSMERLKNRVKYLKKALKNEDAYKIAPKKNKLAWENFLALMQTLLSKKIDKPQNKATVIKHIQDILKNAQIISERPWLQEKITQKGIQWVELVTY